MKAKPKKLRRNSPEVDKRFPEFERLYIEHNGNAYKAAQAAGYPEKYAKSHAYLLVAKMRLRAAPVLKRNGLDEFWVVKRLKQLAGARTPKWNRSRILKPATTVKQPDGSTLITEPAVVGGWDKFADGPTRLRTVEVVADLLSMHPPKKIEGTSEGGAIPIIIRTSIPRPDRARVN